MKAMGTVPMMRLPRQGDIAPGEVVCLRKEPDACGRDDLKVSV
jgi:hypothetical protein